LEKAYEGDSFNTWTYNTLNLLDSFQHFVRFDTTHFKVKLHENEVAVLSPYVADLLEKAYNTLTEKYGFKPEGMITFEMYPDKDDFVVRSLGLRGSNGILAFVFETLFGWVRRPRKGRIFSIGAALCCTNLRMSLPCR